MAAGAASRAHVPAALASGESSPGNSWKSNARNGPGTSDLRGLRVSSRPSRESRDTLSLCKA